MSNRGMMILRVFLLLFLLFGLESCVVWKKQYDAEVSARKRAERENAKLKTQLGNARKRIKDLENEVASLQKNIADLKAEKDSLRVASNDNINNLSGKLNNLNKELQEKERLLNEKEAALAEKEKTVQELQDLLNQQRRAVEELRSKISDALAAFDDDELKVEVRDGKVYVSLSEKLLFRSGSTNVDAKGQTALKKLAEVLARNTDIQIQIEGHTDSVPVGKGLSYKDNWDLSVLRATSIVRILTSNGLTPERILPSGRGEFYPVETNETADGRSKNRRTEIILSPKLDELLDILGGEKFNK